MAKFNQGDRIQIKPDVSQSGKYAKHAGKYGEITRKRWNSLTKVSLDDGTVLEYVGHSVVQLADAPEITAKDALNEQREQLEEEIKERGRRLDDLNFRLTLMDRFGVERIDNKLVLAARMAGRAGMGEEDLHGILTVAFGEDESDWPEHYRRALEPDTAEAEPTPEDFRAAREKGALAGREGEDDNPYDAYFAPDLADEWRLGYDNWTHYHPLEKGDPVEIVGEIDEEKYEDEGPGFMEELPDAIGYEGKVVRSSDGDTLVDFGEGRRMWFLDENVALR